MNETAAKEWLIKAWHHISSARLLLEANHYSDIIAIEIHYGIELTLKAYTSYRNGKILKTHDLFVLYDRIESNLNLTEAEIRKLVMASDYHISEAYPVSERLLPDLQEVRMMLIFAEELFEKSCNDLGISQNTVKE